MQNIQVTGLVDQCNLTQLAQYSIKRNPDLTFNLKSVYVLPKLVVTRNVHLKNRINEHPNFLGNIALRDDHRPLKVDLTFSSEVVATQLTINSLINQKYNLTHLLHDAVYVHVPQVITGRKVFHRPLTIYGFVSQTPGRQLQVGGHMNSVNVSRLFSTTVMADRNQRITGNKHFLGRIRFSGPITLGQGLNGAPVPQGYYLTHTNEHITGETYFTKRVHVNQNLNARLINHVNLTQFVNNLIYVQPVKSVPRSALPMDATSVVTFEDGIYIKNLTIRNRINDIRVEDLLHQNSKVQVSGYKVFQKPIRIYGNLQLGTVNSIDFEHDLKREWIDTRRNVQSIPIHITGTLVIKRPTQMDHLNIAEKLNSFTFDQFDPKYFANLNQTVFRLNSTLKREIHNLRAIEENLQEFVRVDYINGKLILVCLNHLIFDHFSCPELRYFVMLQNFAKPEHDFFANTHLQFSRANNLMVTRSKLHSLAIDVARIDLNTDRSSVIQSLQGPFLDFDLIQLPPDGTTQPLILLSVVHDLTESMYLPKENRPSASVLIWDPNQMFQLTKQFRLQLTRSARLYSRTKFFQSQNFGTLLLFSTVRQKTGGDLCPVSSANIPASFENIIDIFRRGPTGFHQHQRIILDSLVDDLAAGTMDLVEIGKHVYLFTLSRPNTVEMFQSTSSGQFSLVSSYRVPGVNSLRLFWKANTLYMALGSHLSGKSQLLAALLSHGDYYPTV